MPIFFAKLNELPEFIDLESTYAKKTDLPADYIIEEGYDSSTGWWYWKYNSGYVDMIYRKIIGSLALTSNKVQGVYSNDAYVNAVAKYPFEFQNVIYSNSNVSSNGYTLSQVASTTNTQLTYRLWAPYSSTVSSCVVMIRLVGILKQ